MSEFYKEHEQVLDHLGKLPDWYIGQTLERLTLQICTDFNEHDTQPPSRDPEFISNFRDELAYFTLEFNPLFHDEVVTAGFFAGIDSLYPERVKLKDDMLLSEKGLIFAHSAFFAYYTTSGFLLDYDFGDPVVLDEPEYDTSRFGDILSLEEIEEEGDEILALSIREYGKIKQSWEPYIEPIHDWISYEYDIPYVRLGIGYAAYRLNELHAEVLERHNGLVAERKALEARNYLSELGDADIVGLIEKSGRH